MNYCMVMLVQTKDVKCVTILKKKKTVRYRKEAVFEHMHDVGAFSVKTACEEHFHGQKASLGKALT